MRHFSRSAWKQNESVCFTTSYFIYLQWSCCAHSVCFPPRDLLGDFLLRLSYVQQLLSRSGRSRWADASDLCQPSDWAFPPPDSSAAFCCIWLSSAGSQRLQLALFFLPLFVLHSSGNGLQEGHFLSLLFRLCVELELKIGFFFLKKKPSHFKCMSVVNAKKSLLLLIVPNLYFYSTLKTILCSCWQVVIKHF